MCNPVTEWFSPFWLLRGRKTDIYIHTAWHERISDRQRCATSETSSKPWTAHLNILSIDDSRNRWWEAKLDYSFKMRDRQIMVHVCRNWSFLRHRIGGSALNKLVLPPEVNSLSSQVLSPAPVIFLSTWMDLNIHVSLFLFISSFLYSLSQFVRTSIVHTLWQVL